MEDNKPHYPSEYELKRIEAHIKLVRYLIAKADVRGVTHGEKHHIMVVALQELITAQFLITGEQNFMDRWEDTDPTNILKTRSRF